MNEDPDLGTASTLPFSVSVPGYRLRREAGADSLGIWLDAEQEKLGRKVTVKVLRPQLEGHEGARREFLAEMDRLAPLDHPNVLHVLDTVREGTLVLVVERIGSRTAATLLEPGKPLGEAVSLGLARGIARGLAYLLEHGLAHKNVAPHLVSVRPEGEPRLITFRNVIPFAELVSLKGRLAQDTRYIAPEQVAGDDPVGPTTPSYTVAALLFHFLTGRPPHSGEPKDAARAHLAEPFPSLKRLQPFLKPGFYELMAACTSRSPGERPELPEVVAALEALLEGREMDLGGGEAKGPAAAPRPRRRRRRF